MPWAQIIGAGITAYGNYKANKKNEQAAEDTFQKGIDAVKPRPVTGGVGSSSYTDEGGTVFGLNDKYQAEADYFLDDAAINKGFLTDYQKGGPAAAANTLFQERVDPLRRNQARAEAQFDEQGNARGMLGASEMMFARGQNTAGYQQAESAVYNQSYTDVQDIIDRYRARISTGVNQAVNIEGLPSGYFDQSLTDAGNRASIVEAGMGNMNKAQEASNAYNAKTATSLGSWLGDQKFSTGSKSAGTHNRFVAPRGGMVSGPMSYLK